MAFKNSLKILFGKKDFFSSFVGLAPHFSAQFASRPGLARPPSHAPRAVPRPRSGNGHRVATVRRRRPPGGAPAGPTARSPRLSSRQHPARLPDQLARPFFIFLRHSALSQQQRAGSSIDAEQAPSPARSPPRNHHLQLALSSAFTSPSYSISPSSRRTQGSGPI